MIDLFYWPTPNGRKVSILLEEIDAPYKIIKIDITKEKQFSKDFTNISRKKTLPRNKSYFCTFPPVSGKNTSLCNTGDCAIVVQSKVRFQKASRSGGH